MIKVINVVPALDAGGVEIMLYNYLSQIDKSKFEISIGTYSSYNGIYREKFENLGIQIFEIPSKKNFIKSTIFQLKLFKNKNFDVVHVHLDDLSFLTLFIAFCVGIKTRIVHTHCGIYNDGRPKWFHAILRWISINFANKYFACSKKAADDFYGKKFKEPVFVMTNCIDSDKFVFNNSVRTRLRLENNFLKTDIVIGNVARLSREKNPFFVVDIIRKLHKKNPNVKFVFIGDGYLRKELETYIQLKEAKGYIKLLGEKVNANDYYNMLDMFLLPSLSEGFGISFIEAQINGLTTVCSTNVPKEVEISNFIHYIDLNEDLEQWVNIVQMCIGDDCIMRNKILTEKFQYKLKKAVHNLENEYLQ